MSRETQLNQSVFEKCFPHYEMSSAEAYTDFYSISYIISDERPIYGPDHTLIEFTDFMITELFGVIGSGSYEELCQEHIIRFERHTQDKIYGILLEMEQEWNTYNRYSELLLKGLLNPLIITCL